MSVFQTLFRVRSEYGQNGAGLLMPLSMKEETQVDCKTGEIHHFADAGGLKKAMEKLSELEQRQLLELTEKQGQELAPLAPVQRKNNMRNKPCPCGSGHKFKRCCWGKYT